VEDEKIKPDERQPDLEKAAAMEAIAFIFFIAPIAAEAPINNLGPSPAPTAQPQYCIHVHLNVRRGKLLIPTNTASQWSD